jgi:hypothetical protein
VSDIAALIESALAVPRGLRCAIDVMDVAHASSRGPSHSVRSVACRTHTTVRRTSAALSSRSPSRSGAQSAPLRAAGEELIERQDFGGDAFGRRHAGKHTHTRAAQLQPHTHIRTRARVRSARTAGSCALQHRSLPPMAVSPTSR